MNLFLPPSQILHALLRGPAYVPVNTFAWLGIGWSMPLAQKTQSNTIPEAGEWGSAGHFCVRRYLLWHLRLREGGFDETPHHTCAILLECLELPGYARVSSLDKWQRARLQLALKLASADALLLARQLHINTACLWPAGGEPRQLQPREWVPQWAARRWTGDVHPHEHANVVRCARHAWRPQSLRVGVEMALSCFRTHWRAFVLNELVSLAMTLFIGGGFGTLAPRGDVMDVLTNAFTIHCTSVPVGIGLLVAGVRPGDEVRMPGRAGAATQLTLFLIGLLLLATHVALDLQCRVWTTGVLAYNPTAPMQIWAGLWIVLFMHGCTFFALTLLLFIYFGNQRAVWWLSLLSNMSALLGASDVTPALLREPWRTLSDLVPGSGASRLVMSLVMTHARCTCPQSAPTAVGVCYAYGREFLWAQGIPTQLDTRAAGLWVNVTGWACIVLVVLYFRIMLIASHPPPPPPLHAPTSRSHIAVTVSQPSPEINAEDANNGTNNQQAQDFCMPAHWRSWLSSWRFRSTAQSHQRHQQQVSIRKRWTRATWHLFTSGWMVDVLGLFIPFYMMMLARNSPLLARPDVDLDTGMSSSTDARSQVNAQIDFVDCFYLGAVAHLGFLCRIFRQTRPLPRSLPPTEPQSPPSSSSNPSSSPSSIPNPSPGSLPVEPLECASAPCASPLSLRERSWIQVCRAWCARLGRRLRHQKHASHPSLNSDRSQVTSGSCQYVSLPPLSGPATHYRRRLHRRRRLRRLHRHMRSERLHQTVYDDFWWSSGVYVILSWVVFGWMCLVFVNPWIVAANVRFVHTTLFWCAASILCGWIYWMYFHVCVRMCRGNEAIAMRCLEVIVGVHMMTGGFAFLLTDGAPVVHWVSSWSGAQLTRRLLNPVLLWAEVHRSVWWLAPEQRQLAQALSPWAWGAEAAILGMLLHLVVLLMVSGAISFQWNTYCCSTCQPADTTSPVACADQERDPDVCPANQTCSLE